MFELKKKIRNISTIVLINLKSMNVFVSYIIARIVIVFEYLYVDHVYRIELKFIFLTILKMVIVQQFSNSLFNSFVLGYKIWK